MAVREIPDYAETSGQPRDYWRHKNGQQAGDPTKAAEAWASMKSFRLKDGSGDPLDPGRNGERDFHGEKRSDVTHASATDPDARLYHKADGRESRLCYMGHALMENRNGPVVDACLTLASGTAERQSRHAMLDRLPVQARRITLGADKAYDVSAFVGDLRQRQVTPHITVNGSVSKTGKVRKTLIDKRTTRHLGYAISLRCRKRIEEAFDGSRRRPTSLDSRSAVGRKHKQPLASPSQHARNPKLLAPTEAQ